MSKQKPNHIYHYTKLSTALEHILPKMQLRLNKFSNSNDPREKGGRGFIYENIMEVNVEDFSRIDNTLNNKIFDSCKFISFSRDKDIYRGYQLTNQWAYYGDKHKGVCLQFNYDKFLNENIDTLKSFINFRNVDYKVPKQRATIYDRIKVNSKELISNDELLMEFISTNRKELYFTKTTEWLFEQEVRAIIFSNTNQEEYCKIIESLEGIFLGCDFDLVYLPSILKLIVDKNIRVFKLNYDERSGTEQLQPFPIPALRGL